MRLIALALLLSILFAACTQLTAEQIVAKAQEKWESLEDFKAEVTMTTGNQTQKAIFMLKKPNKFKIIQDNALTVFNGTTQWFYSPEKSEAIRMNFAESSQMDMGLTLETIRRYDIQLVGEEEFDGRSCYVIKATPKDKVIEYQLMWIDKETWTPLKVLVKGKAVDWVVEYRNVTINSGIPDEEFEFVPPENVTVKVIERKKPELPEIKIVESFEEAERIAGFKILVPAYTAGFQLKEIQVQKGKKVSLHYRKASGFLQIDEKPERRIVVLPVEEKVSVKGYDAYYSQRESGDRKYQRLRFIAGELYITISSNTKGELSREELIRIAESMLK